MLALISIICATMLCWRRKNRQEIARAAFKPPIDPCSVNVEGSTNQTSISLQASPASLSVGTSTPGSESSQNSSSTFECDAVCDAAAAFALRAKLFAEADAAADGKSAQEYMTELVEGSLIYVLAAFEKTWFEAQFATRNSGGTWLHLQCRGGFPLECPR
jgi:hypothetical protein